MMKTIDYGQLTTDYVHTEFRVNGQLSMVNTLLTQVTIPNWAYYLFAGILGACVGSFSNVCIVRIPRGESIILPPSHCRHCGHELSWWENIPLISFLILKGQCRHCKGTISALYPIVELIAVLLSLATWWKFHNIKLFLIYYFLLAVPLIIISFIDMAHRIIPDVISLPGIVLGILVNVFLVGGFKGVVFDSVMGILVGGGFLYIVATLYEKLKKIEGLGGGDVKLAAMLGAFFGWRAVIFILLVSSVVGSIVGLFMIVVMKKNFKFAIPFGPFLSLGGLIYLYFGPELIKWYLNLL